MAKGWITISNNSMKSNKEERESKAHLYDKMMRSIRIRSSEQMKKEAEEFYTKKQAQENSLIEAYKSGILKSENLKKKANNLIIKKKSKTLLNKTKKRRSDFI